MKNNSLRFNILKGFLATVVVVCITYYMLVKPGARPEPNHGGYYTGPMKSKGDPNIYGNDEGVKVPPPPESNTSVATAAPKPDDNAPKTAPGTAKPADKGASSKK